MKGSTIKELVCDAGVLIGVAVSAVGISKTSEAGALVFIGLAITFIAIKVAAR